MSDTSFSAGATGKIITFEAFTISTGAPYTGGAFNTSGITATYCRDESTAVAMTLVTATAGTYTSSGFVHRGAAIYELGVPAAALVTGADGAEFRISGITDVYFKPVRVEILGIDPRSATAPDVNVAKWAATTVTVPDIAGSPKVTITAGTGTGQLDFTAGVVKSNLVQILATALTETAGLIAAGFKKFFNVATPTLTTAGVDQTGDNFARLGAPAGASVSADIAAIETHAAATDITTTAIKAKTDNLPASPADESFVIAATDTLMSAVAAVPTATENADTLLDRDMAAGADTGANNKRTVRQALRASRNKVDITAGHVYKEDDTTSSHNISVTTNPSAEPVTAITPS